MKVPIFIKEIIPFVFLYSCLIFISIGLDYLLHYLNLFYIGRYLGPIGTVLILISFIYSLNKHKIIHIGSSPQLLKIHEILAFIGSILILVHAGIHFNAILPWLAIVSLLINVASGLIGKFILKMANLDLLSNRKELVSSGMSESEIEKNLSFDSIVVKGLKKWRMIHLPIAYTLGILSLLHLISILIFSS